MLVVDVEDPGGGRSLMERFEMHSRKTPGWHRCFVRAEVGEGVGFLVALAADVPQLAAVEGAFQLVVLCSQAMR